MRGDLAALQYEMADPRPNTLVVVHPAFGGSLLVWIRTLAAELPYVTDVSVSWALG